MNFFKNTAEENHIENIVYVISEAATAHAEALDNFLKISEMNDPEIITNVFLECFFLYLHLLTRITFGVYGHKKTEKLQNKISPYILEKLAIIYQRNFSNINLLEAKKELLLILNKREFEYGQSSEFLSKDKSFTGNSMLTKFAKYLCIASRQSALNPATMTLIETSFEPNIITVLKEYIKKEVTKIL